MVNGQLTQCLNSQWVFIILAKAKGRIGTDAAFPDLMGPGAF
jgi:hypothetical protein